MNLKSMLERDEGRVKHAYQDTEGYWTIGRERCSLIRRMVRPETP